MVHNETTNIWSHLIGAFVLLFVAFLTYNDSLLNIVRYNLLSHQVSENIQIKIQELKIDNYLTCPVSKNFQQIKVHIQKEVIPELVHKFQNAISYHTHELINFIYEKFYLNANETFISKQNTKNVKINSEDQSLARWPLIFYLICNSICLLCSVTYHWFYPLSKKAHDFCVCTDFAGISVLYAGSAIPCVYYGMYCYFQVAQVYLTLNIITAIAVFFLSFTEKFQSRNNSSFRVIIYALFSCFMVSPLFHMAINQIFFNNYNDQYSFVSSAEWYTLGMIFYGIGGFFYSSQFPNCLSKTGKYDILGHSHHYWHTFVVLAIISIYIGCLQNYFTRSNYQCS